MKVTITGRHMEIPEALEQMLMAKADRLERFGHKLISMHAIFGREKYLYTAELTLAGKGIDLVGKAKHPKDILTCMEEALTKLERQLKRHDEKRVELLRRRAPHRPA